VVGDRERSPAIGGRVVRRRPNARPTTHGVWSVRILVRPDTWVPLLSRAELRRVSRGTDRPLLEWADRGKRPRVCRTPGACQRDHHAEPATAAAAERAGAFDVRRQLPR